MKIVVLTGSPHEKGTTSVLADAFISGAEESGHEIYRFDAGLKSVNGCIACNSCGNGETPCVFEDDMQELIPHLLEADMVAFVSPVFYSGFTSQLKAVIDRFYSIDRMLCGSGKKAALLAAAADTQQRTAKGLRYVYEEAMHYLQWKDCGQIYAVSCATREDIEKTDYPQQAYELGKNIK